MTDHTVVDANCWSQFVDEEVANINGVARATFAKAQTVGAILLDEGGLIKSQYAQVKRGIGELLFEGFFEKGVLAGTIRLVSAAADQQLRQCLLGLGVPQGEHIYFRTAKSGGAKHIVSEDIDFFDPNYKQRGEAEKARIKQRANGAVCKEFRRNHGILILCMDGFTA